MNVRPALVAVNSDFPNAPPHNLDAEQALLGVLLVDNNYYYKVFEIVDAGDFYDPVHGRIYDAIAKTVDGGRVADAKTLRGQFDAEEALKALGGAKYLVDLCASVITSINAPDYAKLIHELATRRRLIAFSHEVKGIAFDQDAPPTTGENLINAAETKLFQLAERRGTEGAVDMLTAFDATIEVINKAMKQTVGLTTGLARLDEMMGGLRPGKLYTIAARPAMGKTALGLTIAANAAQAGARVLFHTLEMERDEIVQRLIARITGIPSNKQTSTALAIEDFRKIYETRDELGRWPLYIDDGAGLKISQIRGRAIRQKRRYGLDLLVIDYLGLIAATDPRVNRNYQIEEITQGLKNLAKELKIPVVLLAQLNRELEKRDDKRPMMSDLRDSGSVEQDSDVVMFIYRHEYYITRNEPRRNDRETDEKFNERYTRWQAEVEKSRRCAELIIAKLRQGQTGTVPLKYEGWRCHFYEDTGGGDNGAT